jgi:hypothetical protein
MPSLALLGSIALLLSAAQDAGSMPDQSGSPGLPKTSAKQLASIGASAYAATLTPDGYVLLITRTSLVRVDLDGKTRVLHRGKWDDFFDTGYNASSFFYPSSMALTPTGDVFIGMRAVVVHLKPQTRGYTEEWLVPATCPAPNEPLQSPHP